MRPDFVPTCQRGFGLVAALFLILVIAGVIAAMARLAVTQHGTSSLALQQARAYQAARAGLEWGIARALANQTCSDAFSLDGARVSVRCDAPLSGPGTGELIPLTAVAEYSAPGSPEHVYRQLQAVIEREKQP